MSVSGFHHHFKAVTTMSPLQFRKQVRLQEARRLLLWGDAAAASAGCRVGYGDASQFNREDKRLVGAPPIRAGSWRAAGFPLDDMLDVSPGHMIAAMQQ